jgi:hypothetical protein
VTADPDHAFRRPRFAVGGAAVDDVIDLFRAGEPVDAVAEEFGLSCDEVEDGSVSQPHQPVKASPCHASEVDPGTPGPKNRRNHPVLGSTSGCRLNAKPGRSKRGARTFLWPSEATLAWP